MALQAPLCLRASSVIQVDASRTTVQFTLGAIGHTVHGTFHTKSGTIHFDPTTGHTSGQIVVDVRSGETGNGNRDRKMHQDILESPTYPEAIFSPDWITGSLAPQGESQIQVHGFLAIHGGKHEMTIPAKVQIQNGAVSATASFVVPYVDWGMKNPSTFILRVKENVDVEVRLVGRIN
jgi:polyisoprenoid-binding protein YceI